MTQGRKSSLKRDHNWDLERMQFEKDKGNIHRKEDYVNKKEKDPDAAMGEG